MVGGSKRAASAATAGLRIPHVHHRSIPAQIRNLAQTITSPVLKHRGTSAPSTSLDQSVGFIVQNAAQCRSNPTRRKSPAAKHQNIQSASSSKRPISLHTQSSGYESEAHGSETWEWTAAEVLWKWQSNNLKTKKVGKLMHMFIMARAV